MSEDKLDNELITELERTILVIKQGNFTGVLWRSDVKNEIIIGKAVHGTMDDRINVVDYMFKAINKETNKTARAWGIMELYKRFKHYFHKINSLMENKLNEDVVYE